MSQQINLLIRKRSLGLSALAPIAVPGLALVLSVGLWIKGEEDIAAARAAETASARRLQEVNGALQARHQQAGMDLKAEITVLKARAEGAQKFLAQLDELGSRKGFAHYFSTLGTIAEDGLWLTSVAVGGRGKSLSVSGLALRRETVLRYAQRLNKAVAGEGLQFSTLEMGAETAGARANGPPSAVAVPFRISTAGALIR